MQQTFQAVFKTNEDTEVGDLGDLTRNFLTWSITLRDIVCPRIFCHLLQTQSDTTTISVNRQDLARKLLAFFQNFVRVADFARPRHIRHVQQSVDALFQLDERTVVGKVANLASNLFARWVLFFDFVPWVFLSLLHAQRHLLARLVDSQNRNLDLVANVDQLVRMVNTLDPRHFRDVNKSFDTRLKFNKGTVVHYVDNFTGVNATNWVLRFNFVPRVR